jgi:hypothetical protein
MTMGVDASFYIFQIVFFVWGAVLLGAFVKCLIDEVKPNGWRTARAVWSYCLFASSTVFVITYLDPRTLLGLYSVHVVNVLVWFEVLTLSQSIAFAAYMYLSALYRRNVGSVPPLLRGSYLWFNIGCSLAHAVLSLVGAATDNMFWLGVSELFLVVQETVIILVLHVSLCKLARYLQSLTQAQTAVGAKFIDFKDVLRKMCWVRVSTIIFYLFACIYEIALPGQAMDRLSKPHTPFSIDNSSFQIIFLASPLMVCILHCIILYMMLRPQSKSEKSSRTPTKESSSSTA